MNESKDHASVSAPLQLSLQLFYASSQFCFLPTQEGHFNITSETVITQEGAKLISMLLVTKIPKEFLKKF